MTASSEPAVEPDLVYDIGCWDGSDTAFYLRSGYRVVAVDANPEVIRRLERAFGAAVQSGKLAIVHGAVAASGAPETVTFYVSEQESWSSLVPSIAGIDGLETFELEVPTTSLQNLIQRFGTPYYLKIDIEGTDEVALEDLVSTRARPTYVSVEVSSSDAQGRRRLELLVELGYSRFKLVDQSSLRVLSPADLELGQRGSLLTRVRYRLSGPRKVRRVRGRKVAFPLRSSGPFGEDLAGEWCDADQARELYVAARRAYFQREDARSHGFWCDWHATT
jgi:FkbM family methyltransferase